MLLKMTKRMEMLIRTMTMFMLLRKYSERRKFKINGDTESSGLDTMLTQNTWVDFEDLTPECQEYVKEMHHKIPTSK